MGSILSRNEPSDKPGTIHMLSEVLQGLSTDADAATVLRDLRRFEILETGGVDRLDQALDSAFARRTGMVSSVPHPVKGDLHVIANPLRIDGERPAQAACAPLGADNMALLGKRT